MYVERNGERRSFFFRRQSLSILLCVSHPPAIVVTRSLDSSVSSPKNCYHRLPHHLYYFPTRRANSDLGSLSFQRATLSEIPPRIRPRYPAFSMDFVLSLSRLDPRFVMSLFARVCRYVEKETSTSLGKQERDATKIPDPTH